MWSSWGFSITRNGGRCSDRDSGRFTRIRRRVYGLLGYEKGHAIRSLWTCQLLFRMCSSCQEVPRLQGSYHHSYQSI